MSKQQVAALLLATDRWEKMEIYENHLTTQPSAVWRTKGRNTKSLEEIIYPVNLYFFHNSIVRYRARCIDIQRGKNWRLENVPPEFRDDATPYTLFFVIDDLEKVPDTHISEFPKWHDPKKRFERGLMGLQKAVDVLG